MTLQFGLNDCNCWETDRGLPRVSEEAFRANLIEMIERARLFGARSIVLSTNHRTLRHDTLPNGECYEDANARYSESSARSPPTPASTSATFERPSSRSRTASWRSCSCRPRRAPSEPEGNRVYAEAIWPHVERAASTAIGRETTLEHR